MATLIGDVDLSAWTLQPPKAGRQMTIAGIRSNGQVPRAQLVPKSEMGTVWTPFPPSVFQGNGTEPRRTIVFSVPDHIRRYFERIEEWARDAARPSTPNVDAIWISGVRPSTNFPPSIRAKITLSGPGACTIVDENGAPTEPPEEWAGRAVTAALEFRGLYLQRASAGLLVEVVALMVGPVRQSAGPAPVEFV